MVFKKKAQPEPSRRAAAALRQAELKEDTSSTQAYRRNRTLNSRHTSSPMETSDRLEAHKLIKRRRSLTRRLIVSLLGLLLIFLLLSQLTVYCTILTPDTKSAQNAAKYEQVLNDYYAARPAERFKFFRNDTDLLAFFVQKAPEVKTVRIEEGFLARSSVKLQFRQPVAQWLSGNAVYFVDETGVTFEQNYFETPRISVRDESGIPAESGREVINRQFLSFLGRVIALFSQNNMTVAEATLPSNTVRQVWFKLNGKPYDIRMVIDRESEAQVKQAIMTMQYLESHQLKSSYIDVRVDQRSFYK